MKKENNELRNRLGDALVMAEEGKIAVAAMRRELDAEAAGKEEVYVALSGRLSRLEKEVLVYRVLMKCSVVLLLLAVFKAWM